MESALYDLQDLEDVIKNQMTVTTIEHKLPVSMTERWLLYEQDRMNGITPNTYFERLLLFLKGQEEVLERLAELELGTCAKEKQSHCEETGEKKGGKRSFTEATSSKVKETTRRRPS